MVSQESLDGARRLINVRYQLNAPFVDQEDMDIVKQINAL
jgi:hypothetical protein